MNFFVVFFLGAYLQFEWTEGIRECNKTLWRVLQNSSNPIGHARLQLKLHKTYENGLYDVVLACEGLIVQGAGIQSVELIKRKVTFIQFGLQIPHGLLKNATKDSTSHSCVFELKKRKSNSTYHVLTECELKVKSALVRLVPHCDKISKTLVKHIKVWKGKGTANVYFENSANGVVRVGHACKINPMYKYIEAGYKPLMEHENSELYGLTAIGTSERIYSVSFYPDCDAMNTSHHKELMTEHAPDCYLSVHAVCQEGEISLKTFYVDLDKESMYCHPPKPVYIKFIENIKLKFRIESGPVAGLLCLLFFNISLYLILLPCLVTKCAIHFNKLVRGLNLKSIHRKVKRWNCKSRKKTRNIDFSDEDQGDRFFGIEKSTNLESYDGDVLLAYKSNRKENQPQKQHESLSSTPKKLIMKDLITFSDEKKIFKQCKNEKEKSKKKKATPKANEYKPTKLQVRKNNSFMKHKKESNVSCEGQYRASDEDPLPSAYNTKKQLISECKVVDDKKYSKLAKRKSKLNKESVVKKSAISHYNNSFEVVEKSKKSVLDPNKSQPFHVPLAEDLQHEPTKLGLVAGQRIKSRKISLDSVKKAGSEHPSVLLNGPSLHKPVSIKEEQKLFSKQKPPQNTRSIMLELFTSDTNLNLRGNDGDEKKIRVFPLKPRQTVKYTLVRRHSSTYSQGAEKSPDHNLKHYRRYSYEGPSSRDSRDSIKSSTAKKPRLKDLDKVKSPISEPKVYYSNHLQKDQPTSTELLQSTHLDSYNHQWTKQEAPEAGHRHSSRDGHGPSLSHNTPEVGHRRSSRDSHDPSLSHNTPEVGHRHSTRDGHGPSLSHNTPEVGHRRSSRDSHDPSLSHNTPEVGHRHSTRDGHGPSLSHNTPEVGHRHSTRDGHGPSLSHNTPEVGHRHSSRDGHGPSLSHNTPEVGHRRSSRDSHDPSLSHNTPEVGHRHSTRDGHGPSLSHNTPEVGHRRSSRDSHGPSLSHNTPEVGHRRSSRDSHDPSSHNTPEVGHRHSTRDGHGPSLSHNTPEVGHRRSSRDGHDPSLSHNTPEVGHHRSTRDGHGPSLSHNTPEVGQRRSTRDGHGSSLSHNTPEVGHHRSSRDGHGPSLSHNTPEVGYRRSTRDGHGPSLSHNTPEVGYRHSSRDGHGPSLSHNTPEVGHRHSSRDGQGPSLSHNTPEVGHHRSTRDGHGPSLSHNTPEVGQRRSTHDGHGPSLSHNIPAVGQRRSSRDGHGPSLSYNKPEVGHRRSSLDGHRPSLSHNMPEVGHQKERDPSHNSPWSPSRPYKNKLLQSSTLPSNIRTK